MRRPQDQQSTPTPAPTKPAKRVRAIAVVELLAGGGARLVPIALWMEGKYYDASLYQANPAPFVLQPGTVYEAQNYGETAGIFVVNTPQLSNGGWIGDGRWTARRALDAKVAAEAAKQSKPRSQGKAIFTGGSDEGPPVLRRPGSEQSSDKSTAPATAPAQSPPSPADPSQSPPATSAPVPDTSGRPTLRRPNEETGSPPATVAQQPQPSSATVDDTDPNRPVLRKPNAPAQNVSSTPVSTGGPSADVNDPERPVLTRGGKAAASSAPKVPASGTGTAATVASAKSGSTRSLAAISDAGKYENRPLLYTTTPERQQQLERSMLELALADIRTFAGKHTTSPQLGKSAQIKNYDVRFFDLDFSNSATLVLTAKLPMPTAGSRPFLYYAAIVARLDINGDPVKIFSSITDTTHLDVFPRLELIDALDADGNGRGDLLFRQYSDTGINYGLYRVFPYNMEKVFEGGASL